MTGAAAAKAAAEAEPQRTIEAWRSAAPWMRVHPVRSRRVEEYAAPTLPSRSLDETLALSERLGFENAGDAPDVCDYLIIRRGTIELHFYLDTNVDPLTTSTGCFAWVKDADTLHSEWRRTGLQSDAASGSRVVEPVDTKYGVRTFALIDPSGNQIRFGTGRH